MAWRQGVGLTEEERVTRDEAKSLVVAHTATGFSVPADHSGLPWSALSR